MPEISLRYLVDYLFEVGPAGAGAFGATPLTHSELLAWQINMRRMLQPWEINMLRRLSAEWVAESYVAQEPDARPPWMGEIVTSEEKRSVASRLKAALKGMAS